jgi:hypothetical protein
MVENPHRQDGKVLVRTGQDGLITFRGDLPEARMANDVPGIRGREQLRVAGDGHLGRAGVVLGTEMEDDVAGGETRR